MLTWRSRRDREGVVGLAPLLLRRDALLWLLLLLFFADSSCFSLSLSLLPRPCFIPPCHRTSPRPNEYARPCMGSLSAP